MIGDLRELTGRTLPQNIVAELEEWTGHSENFILFEGFGVLEGDRSNWRNGEKERAHRLAAAGWPASGRKSLPGLPGSRADPFPGPPLSRRRLSDTARCAPVAPVGRNNQCKAGSPEASFSFNLSLIKTGMGMIGFPVWRSIMSSLPSIRAFIFFRSP